MTALVLCVALGVAATVEMIKQILPWPLTPKAKSVMTLVLSAVVFGFAPAEWSGKQVGLAMFGAFGLAPIFHGIETVLRLRRDDLKSQVMVRAKVGGIRR